MITKCNYKDSYQIIIMSPGVIISEPLLETVTWWLFCKGCCEILYRPLTFCGDQSHDHLVLFPQRVFLLVKRSKKYHDMADAFGVIHRRFGSRDKVKQAA